MKIDLVPDTSARTLGIRVYCFFCDKPDIRVMEMPVFLFPLLIPLLNGQSVLSDIELPGNYLCQHCGEQWQEATTVGLSSAGADTLSVEVKSIADPSEPEPDKRNETR